MPYDGIEEAAMDRLAKEYSLEDDIEKMREECSELYEALSLTRSANLITDDKPRAEVLGEMADVWIMIKRLLRSMKVSSKEFSIYTTYKIDRQLDRIERRRSRG
mgnify:CR=1 FL=1